MNPQSGAMPAERVTSERISQPLWAPRDRPGRNPDGVERAAADGVAKPGAQTAPPFARARRPDPLAEPATIHPDAGRQFRISGSTW
jgi:hypothetical protein